MRVCVTAKIKNSPTMPVEEFKAEKEFDFDENSNVFGRAYEVRKYFKTKYRTENIEIVKAVEL